MRWPSAFGLRPLVIRPLEFQPQDKTTLARAGQALWPYYLSLRAPSWRSGHTPRRTHRSPHSRALRGCEGTQTVPLTFPFWLFPFPDRLPDDLALTPDTCGALGTRLRRVGRVERVEGLAKLA